MTPADQITEALEKLKALERKLTKYPEDILLLAQWLKLMRGFLSALETTREALNARDPYDDSDMPRICEQALRRIAEQINE